MSFISFDITINISPMFEGSFYYQDILICKAFEKFLSFINNKRIILSLYRFFLFASFITLH